ncbi:MAG: PDZ domain-containing protein [Planctomycetaceae bacterium]
MRLQAIQRLAICLTAIGIASTAQGQTVLQKLEGKLREVIPPAAGKPAPAANKEPELTVPRADGSGPEEIEPTKEFQPGYLGLIGDNLPGKTKGVVVTELRPGGPAEKAGVKVGDRIVSIDLVELQDLDDLELLLGGISAGKKVRLGIERDGKPLEIVPTLTQRVATREAIPPVNEAALVPADMTGRGTLGLTVAPLTEAAKTQFGLTVNRGALVSAVRPGSAADRVGIPIGAVIVALDGVRIDTADQLIGMAGGLKVNQEVELTYYSGARLSRKTVRATPAGTVAMGAPPPGVFPDGSAPPPGAGGAPGERPLIRGLEKIIGNAIANGNNGGGGPPGVVQGAPGGPGPVVMPAPLDSPEVIELRKKVDALEAELKDLRARMEKLEKGK